MLKKKEQDIHFFFFPVKKKTKTAYTNYERRTRVKLIALTLFNVTTDLHTH